MSRTRILNLHQTFKRADFAPKFGQLPRYLVEILACRLTEHRRDRLRHVILPASQLQAGLKELLLGLEKSVGSLVPNQFLVRDFAPLRKGLSPVWIRPRS